jgi:hypothetical protein
MGLGSSGIEVFVNAPGVVIMMSGGLKLIDRFVIYVYVVESLRLRLLCMMCDGQCMWSSV